MGDVRSQPFQISFNASIEVDFQGSRVASDGGLILVRELDERLGFGDLIAQQPGKAQAFGSSQRVVLDMASTEIPMYGQQGNGGYNRHFESICYRPLFVAAGKPVNEEIGGGKVSVESGERTAVAGHGVFGRTGTALSGL